MRRVILDTSVLLSWWNRQRSNISRDLTEALAEKWAKELIKLYDSDASVTPVLLEVLGGTTNKREAKLMAAYLKPFRFIDQQNVTPDDWKTATDYAKRIPTTRRPRDLADCLIRAISDRLRFDVETLDRGFPARR